MPELLPFVGLCWHGRLSLLAFDGVWDALDKRSNEQAVTRLARGHAVEGTRRMVTAHRHCAMPPILMVHWASINACDADEMMDGEVQAERASQLVARGCG